MIEKRMTEAQEYLTVMVNGETRPIVGISYLSGNHSTQEIIRYLKDYLREQEKNLKQLVLVNKSNPEIDRTVSIVFRVYMAIMTLEKEVNKIVRFEQRAGSSGNFHKRDRRSHRHARVRKNKDHDGEDRAARNRSRRAA